MRRVQIRQDPPMSLNISSLMDILTILLLFLILSFDSNESNVTPPKGIELPDSVSEVPVKLAVKVSLSKTAIHVEEERVVRLRRARIAPSDLNKDRMITPLLSVLRRHKARLQSGSTSVKDDRDQEAEIIYLEAERGTPFSLLDRVLKTAATAGFTKFRLAVHRRS